MKMGRCTTELSCALFGAGDGNYTPRGHDWDILANAPPPSAPEEPAAGEVFPAREGYIYRTRAMMRPFAACERLRLLAPEAPGAHQAPRRGFAVSWRSRKRLGGSRRQRELAAPESLARRGRVALLPPPSLRPRSARRRAVVGEGPSPPLSETSHRLEMVLLCPFGMSHVWAREVYCPPCASQKCRGLETTMCT